MTSQQDSWPSSPNLNLYRSSTGVANQAAYHTCFSWSIFPDLTPQTSNPPPKKSRTAKVFIIIGSFLCFLGLVFFFSTTLSPAAFAPMEAHAADGEDPGQGQNAAAHGGGAQVNDLGASPSIAMLVIKHSIRYG